MRVNPRTAPHHKLKLELQHSEAALYADFTDQRNLMYFAGQGLSAEVYWLASIGWC
jgi:hypothetical protein